jgi:hypothetical protein
MIEGGEVTLDEAVALFEQALPGWWWKIIKCSISADADTAPEVDDGLGSIAVARMTDERFNSGFSVNLHHTAEHTYTPAEALLTVMMEAVAARDAFIQSGKARPAPSMMKH